MFERIEFGWAFIVSMGIAVTILFFVLRPTDSQLPKFIICGIMGIALTSGLIYICKNQNSQKKPYDEVEKKP